MKHIIRKAYWNYEKEEKWINEMSAKGLAMVDYSWCRYVFVDAEPGEYTYRIELLPQHAGHIESKKYIEFLESTGAEHVASYMRWIYCRKKTVDGPFDLFSDIDSRIKHYQRVSVFWWALTMAELSIGISNIVIGTTGNDYSRIANMNVVMGTVCVAIGVAIFFVGRNVRKKIRKLKKQQTIME